MYRNALEQFRKVQYFTPLKRREPFIDRFRSLDKASDRLHPFWWPPLLKDVLLFHLDVKILVVILELCIDFVFVILPGTVSNRTVIFIPFVIINLVRGEVRKARYSEPTSEI